MNGSFNLGSTGWSGTDLETSYTENAYLGNGSNNRVAEVDGNNSQITVMEQTFKVEHASDTKLTFDTALRTASNSNAGSEGFRVEILDDGGNVIATKEYFPTANSFSSRELDVSFPGEGEYTLRVTELGPNDSLGAIVDNFSLLICFAKGTKLRTETGQVAVEDLKIGQRLWTQSNGLQPLRWIASRKVSIAEQIADPNLRPIRFTANNSGTLNPTEPLLVSPQHRMVLRGGNVQTHFGVDQGNWHPAKSLLDVQRRLSIARQQQIWSIFTSCLTAMKSSKQTGLLSESFFPGEAALGGVEQAAQAELYRLFPELAKTPETYGQTALPNFATMGSCPHCSLNSRMAW